MDIVAVIVDIVGSRLLRERRNDVQAAILEASERTQRTVSAVRPIASTTGDEFQGTFENLRDAVRATLIFRLALPPKVECRFGIGLGEDLGVTDPFVDIRDGSAWWNARNAIDWTRRLEKSQIPSIRTYCDLGDGDFHRNLQAWLNSYLIQRDQIVTTMRANTRRLLLGAIEGYGQTELAERYDVSQGTVSSNLRRGGPAAVLESMFLIEGRLTLP